MNEMRGVFWGFDIAASGMTAEMRRSEIVASNIANMHVTGGPDGDPYRRKMLVFEEALVEARGALDGVGRDGQQMARGVQVGRIEEDFNTPFLPRHDPGHPDADENGYVLMPNVDVFKEMVDMMSIERSFQANVAGMQAYRNMVRASVQHIGR